MQRARLVYHHSEVFHCLNDYNVLCCREKWLSILHHITNKHKWQGCQLFKKCEHRPYSRADAKKKKWLKAGSPSHQLLQGIVTDKKLLESMDKLTLFCHTGSLEIYHSVYNKYMPKRQHFSHKGMYKTWMKFSIVFYLFYLWPVIFATNKYSKSSILPL